MPNDTVYNVPTGSGYYSGPRSGVPGSNPNVWLSSTYRPSGGGGGPTVQQFFPGGGSINSSFLAYQPPVTLSTNVLGKGPIGSGGFGSSSTGGLMGYNASVAGSIGNEYTRDENGNWVLKGEKSSNEISIPDYLSKTPERDSIYASPQYQEAQSRLEESRRRQRQYSDQIAAITNTANQKALSLQGQGRGIPEAIIGGQQAQIYKEAAIQALPIQSQLSIAQGDTEAAQEHLSNLTRYLTEAVNNKFESDKVRYTAVSQYMTEKEKQYTTQLLSEKKNLTDAQSVAFDALAKAGITAPGAYAEVRNAKSVEQVARVKAKYVGSGGGGDIPTPSRFVLPEGADITDPEVIDSLPVSTLTKAVMSGMASPKELTPTDRAAVLSDLYRVGFNPKQYVVTKLNDLVNTWSSMPSDSVGYFSGMKFWESTTRPEVAAFESQRTLLTREIARLFDVGVLSDQDVKNYADAMPSRQDASVEVVKAKVGGIAKSTSARTKTKGSTPPSDGLSDEDAYKLYLQMVNKK